MRIAIVGAGPRGLWAVEELINLAWQRDLELHITVFDGGGVKAYDPAQPDYWLMNVSAAVVETTTLGSFNAHTANTQTYPPRAAVGKFLADSWDALPVPERCTLTHLAQEVADPGALTAEFDQVLEVTGHAGSWADALTGPDVLRVYPHGSLDRIPAGSTVAIRGTSLTFIDAVLDLTLGRGGRFTPQGYEPSGEEPAAIYPVNRSGRFMNVKPDHSPDMSAVVDRLRPQLHAAQDTAEIMSLIHQAATTLCEDSEGIAAVLAGDSCEDGIAELRKSYAVAIGAQPLDARAAVGIAFRALYPDLVQRVSFREELPGFRELARRLEPVAFGPPSRNAARILALIDAGIIQAPSTGELPAADFRIDAVLAPPPHPPVRTDSAGFLPGSSSHAVIGRATELWVLGNDTLSRTQHDVIPRWARRVVSSISPAHVHGVPPMRARLEPWAAQLVAEPQQCQQLLAEFGSPVNVLDARPMLANVDELVEAGSDSGVQVRIFFARKANKGLTFVDTVHRAGHGVDVASFRELSQVLEAGVPGADIILSAAIKSDELLRLAIQAGVSISVDNAAELARIQQLADRPVNVVPRLAPDPRRLPPTRFGERSAVWEEILRSADLGFVQVTGIHVHLHGYSAHDRATALREVFGLADSLTAAGHRLSFVDLGGGVPMSYLAEERQWRHFLAFRGSQGCAPFTWKSDPLRNIYPYWQTPTRGAWLQEILQDTQDGESIADGLRGRGLRLHLEPGRSLLDGCGLILARVEFVKKRSDGVPLVGLAMNRTQCRTTSDDFTVDPIVIRGAGNSDAAELEGYLVGAYCIEDEIILRRRIRFPKGVQPGDIIGIPNTAGYFMHILESASHQIPLAKNVVWPERVVDRIDLRGEVNLDGHRI
ncbi:FAD/NAD(P)-binding protein [Corynebacterium sp. H128]|uniref:FAD/NAD(P)-binding protein n=1 Tax=Corynebacterium sp. H128 TaxID=3133427 RepID=UPI0030A774FD